MAGIDQGKKIRVVVAPHPFKTEKAIYHTEKKSFKDIFEKYKKPGMTIESTIIIDGDKKITDYSLIPSSDIIVMKAVPTGDGSNSSELQQTGKATGWVGGVTSAVGAVLIILGAVLSATGYGAVVGGPLLSAGIGLAASGITTLIGGVVIYNTDIDTPTFSKDKKDRKGLSGAKNSTNLGGMIPILLGRRRIYPFNAALPYTSSVADSDAEAYTQSNVFFASMCRSADNYIDIVGTPSALITKGVRLDNVKFNVSTVYASNLTVTSIIPGILANGIAYKRFYFDKPVPSTTLNTASGGIFNNTFRRGTVTNPTDLRTIRLSSYLFYTPSTITIDGTTYNVIENNTASSGMAVPTVLTVDSDVAFDTFYGDATYTYFILYGLIADISTFKYENVQYLHQLFCPGYNHLSIDESTFKIGDVEITEYISSIASNDINSTTNISYDNSQIVPEITQDGTFPVVYGSDRVIEAAWGEKLLFPNDGEKQFHTFVTSTNTEKMSFTFLFPSGLYYKNSDGNNVAHSISVFYQIYDYTGTTLVTQNTWSITTSNDEAFRRTITYDFDNTDPNTGTEYNDKRQYKIIFSLVNPQNESTDYTETIYVESVRSYTAKFTETGGVWSADTTPIYSPVLDEITLIGMRISSSENYNSVIDEFNFEAYNVTNIYDSTIGSGPTAWQTKAQTSNPAAAFFYLLTDERANPHYIAEADWSNRIDFTSLEFWYQFCDDNELFCDEYITDSITIEEVLFAVCKCGFASWSMIDGKYTIIVDTYRTIDNLPDAVDNSNALIIQYFTPRNSDAFIGSKAFPERDDMLRVGYVDRSTGYEDSTVDIYEDDDNHPVDPKTRTVSTWGIVSADQCYKLAKYELAVAKLRPEAYSFTTDIEYIVCTRGDRIRISYDVPLIGLAQGRVKSAIEDAGTWIGVTVDEECTFEAGKTYGLLIRLNDGSRIELDLVNPATGDPVIANDLVFDSPQAIGSFDPDNLCMFGESGLETRDVIVLKIEPNSELGATITCTDYAPGIFEAISGNIPDYDPGISLPPGYYNINTPSTYTNNGTLSSVATTANKAQKLSLAAVLADRKRVFEGVPIYGCILDSGQIVYSAGTDDSKMYIKYPIQGTTAVKLLDIPVGEIAFGGINSAGENTVIYRNKSDGFLYRKSVEDTSAGVQITSTVSASPVYLAGNDFLYVNVTDGETLYRSTFSDSGNGTQITTFPVSDIDAYEASRICYTHRTGGSYIYTKDLDDVAGTQQTTVYGHSPKFDYYGNLYYSNVEDEGRIYLKKFNESGNGSVSLGSGIPLDTDASGNLLYQSLEDGNVYYVPTEAKIAEVEIEAEENTNAITGTFLTGSVRITNISAQDLQLMGVGDNIYSINLPNGKAKIIYRGSTFIDVDAEAIADAVDAEFQVIGKRILLNAGRVVVPGTISANLLEATAIYSKALTTDLSRSISELNLDYGTAQWRKPDGTVVLDFDANRTGSELILEGTFVLGGTGEDVGDLIDTAQSTADQAILDASSAQATADGKVTTFYQTSAPTAEGIGDLWIDTDDGNRLYRWDGATWVEIQDAEIAQAIANAATAQSTADSKIVTFYQASAPTAVSIGDLWVDTDDSNKLYRWNGSTWDSSRDGTIAVAQATADGKNTVFRQGNTTHGIPTSIRIGDIWYDTDANNTMYTAVIAGADQITDGEWEPKISLKSGNFSTGVSGWQIKENGDAEFNDVSLRGVLESTDYNASTGTGWILDETGGLVSYQSTTLRTRVQNGTFVLEKYNGSTWQVIAFLGTLAGIFTALEITSDAGYFKLTQATGNKVAFFVSTNTDTCTIGESGYDIDITHFGNYTSEGLFRTTDLSSNRFNLPRIVNISSVITPDSLYDFMLASTGTADLVDSGKTLCTGRIRLNDVGGTSLDLFHVEFFSTSEYIRFYGVLDTGTPYTYDIYNGDTTAANGILSGYFTY